MLDNIELKEVNGGASKWIAAGIVGGVVTFIIGLVDGYLRPLRCNSWKTAN